MTRIKLIISLIPLVVLLNGCAAIGTAVSHRNLETQTLMSDSIFMQPVTTHHQKVFVQVRNTTDKSHFTITRPLMAALRAKGCYLVRNPSHANYILQVNLLQMGRTTETAAKEMMASGYGGALEGAVAGGTIAFAAGAALAPAALVGGVATTVADSVVQNVTYSGIVDIKLQQRTSPNAKWHVYRTRILTLANKVNLSFNQAKPRIEQGLVNSISGLF